MTEKEFSNNLQISMYDESQTLLITYRESVIDKTQWDLKVSLVPSITFILKFENEKWKHSEAIAPVIWPVGTNLDFSDEMVNFIITEIENYFNQNYPSYDVYSLYEKMKEG